MVDGWASPPSHLVSGEFALPLPPVRIHGRHGCDRHDILDIIARLQDVHWRYSAITKKGDLIDSVEKPIQKECKPKHWTAKGSTDLAK